MLTVVPSRRQTGIYYGSQARALDRWWTPIQVERMNPSFRLGAYDQGLAGGLQAVAELLVQGVPPTTASGAEPAPAPATPRNAGGGRAGLYWLLGLGVVGLAGWGWWSRLTEWVEDAEQGTRTRVRRSSGADGGGWFGGTGLFGGSGGTGWGSGHGSGWGGGGSNDGGGSSGGGSSGGGDGGSSGGGSTSW